MAFEYLGANALDYEFCDYGTSRRQFRGPETNTGNAYLAAIGGTETFGKFVERPYPKILEDLTGKPVINLGQMYSGVQYPLPDANILDICNRAEATIVQLTCVQNMTNRYYSVHPRRNDRFLQASAVLRSVYPEIDFTTIHFTGHLMQALRTKCPRRFANVITDLREEWLKQLNAQLQQLTNRVVLLWMADSDFDEDPICESDARQPTFVQKFMLDDIKSSNHDMVSVTGTPDEISAGFDRMIFNPMEEPAAEQMLGPIVHQEVARRLAWVLLSD